MKKKFAPIFITLLICCFNIFILFIISYNLLRTKILGLIIIGLIYAIVITWVIIALIINLIKRLREIKEADEDDLSKY
jgi:predicted RND superfamily exporter protein